MSKWPKLIWGKKILLIAKWVQMLLNIWKSFALNRRRSINLQSFVEKRSAAQAIETSFKIIYHKVIYNLIVEKSEKSKHSLWI
jgi:hypothetical protein